MYVIIAAMQPSLWKLRHRFLLNSFHRDIREWEILLFTTTSFLRVLGGKSQLLLCDTGENSASETKVFKNHHTSNGVHCSVTIVLGGEGVTGQSQPWTAWGGEGQAQKRGGTQHPWGHYHITKCQSGATVFSLGNSQRQLPNKAGRKGMMNGIYLKIGAEIINRQKEWNLQRQN